MSVSTEPSPSSEVISFDWSNLTESHIHYFKLDVKFELPIYNGDVDAEKLDNWIKQLEVYCRV